MSSSGATWSWGPADSRTIRALLYSQYGFFGGLAFLILAGVGYRLLRSVGSGEPNLVVLLGVLIVGWFLARTAAVEWAGRSTLRETRPFGEFYRVSRARWDATAAVLGAVVHYLLFAYSPTAWALGFLLGVPAALVGARFLSSEGELDRDARTLTYQGTDVDLNAVAAVRRFTVGERTILWLSFVRSRGDVSTPRLLVVPTRLADAVQDAFETSTAREVESAATERTTRAALLGGALGFLGVAVGIGAVLARNEGPVAAVVLSGVFVCFGLLFLWLAVFDL